MDIKSRKSGIPKDYFWYRNKLELIDVLFSRVKTSDQNKILNIGVGTGDDLSIMKKYGDIFVVDINPEAIETLPDQFCKEKKVCDVCVIDYPDDYFDIVTAFDVLEHIEDDKSAISEINRVLKSDGYLLFTVPALSFLYGSHDRALSHYRRYNMINLKNILSGMRSVKIGYWMSLLFFPIAAKKLIKRKGAKVNYVALPGVFNNLFYFIGKIENYLIKHDFIQLPIGTTIYGMYKKR